MSDPIRRELEPRWVILRRSNGHFESIGSVIESYSVLENACTRAAELRNQHRGQTFVVMALVRQFAFETVPSEGEVKEP